MRLVYIKFVMHLFIIEVNNGYIPQTKQHDRKRQMLFHLGNVTNLLDVTPSNSLPHPFHFVLFKFKDLVAKQHPMKTVTMAIGVVQHMHREV